MKLNKTTKKKNPAFKLGFSLVATNMPSTLSDTVELNVPLLIDLKLRFVLHFLFCFSIDSDFLCVGLALGLCQGQGWGAAGPEGLSLGLESRLWMF